MTPKITIVAAMTRDGGLGRKGELLYRISADMKHFKAVTMGKPIVMGRKTFESFPNGALPGRRNIVITSDYGYSAPGISVAHSREEALSLAGDVEEVMIIGGGEVYRQMMPEASVLELTVIDADAPSDADTFMPSIDFDEWTCVDESESAVDPKSGVSYRFVRYVR